MGNLGALQTISIFGIIFGLIAQLILWLMGKQVDNYMLLYPTWVVIFLVGWVIKKYAKNEHDHHHHH
jgi:L-asparagine transporter-like permease